MNPAEESKSARINEEVVTEQKGWIKNGITSPREKNLVIVGFVFGLLVLCLLCAITMTIVLSSLFPKRDYCYTPHCVKKAGSILRAMNRTENPCENFFNYVCGGWVEEYDVDEDSEIAIMGKMQTKIYKKFNRIIENVKSSQNMSLNFTTDNADHVAYAGIKAIKTYDACNNLYDDYHPKNIIAFMEAFGGWPMAVNNWVDRQVPLEQKIAATLGDFGVPSLFSISVEPDEMDPTRNIIKMSGPELPPIKEKILEVVADIAKNASNKQAVIDEDKNKILELLREIAQKLETASETEDVTKVEDLGQHLRTTIEWEKLFQLLLEGATNTPDAAAVPKVKVIIHNKGAINNVIDLATSSNRTLNNYLAVHILSKHPLLIVKDVEPGANTKPASRAKASVLTEMKETCLQTVAQLLNFAMDHVFVYKQRKSMKEAGTLIDYIQRTFTDFIKGYDWLESSTRERLKKKLSYMNNFIDYPGWLMDKGKVDDYYKDYEYNDTSPVAAYVGMVKYGMRKAFAAYKVKNNREEWPRLSMFSVTTVNAFYLPRENNFVLPRSILNPPIYDENNPKYLTYGSIGTIIGHEITHGFDSDGRYYNEEGRLAKDIWTRRSTANYDKLSKCFVEQYSEYVVDEASGTTVDGNKTLAENIADNGGIRQAFQAYRTWEKEINKGRKELSLPGLGAYTPEQMFFISYGQTWCVSAGKAYLRNQVRTDEHTPNYYRVIGTLSNMDEFKDAFDCRSGSAMNRRPKCVLW